jgi:hypothetical protein
MFIATYLKQSLSLAWVSISNIFLPLEKCIFLHNLQVIEIYKPPEQHTCNNNLQAVTKATYNETAAKWVGAVKPNSFRNRATFSITLGFTK